MNSSNGYSHAVHTWIAEGHATKYMDKEAKQFLAEIRAKYNPWVEANQKLKGPYAEPKKEDGEIIAKRVALFNEYKNFVDQQKYAEKFDSRSNLHSSILEEFIFFLFRDLARTFADSIGAHRALSRAGSP